MTRPIGGEPSKTWMQYIERLEKERDCYRVALKDISKAAVDVLIETPRGEDPVMMAPWVAGTANGALRDWS